MNISCNHLDLTVVPNDCTKFNKCINGQLSTISCQSGLVFDRINKKCDLASKVKGYCGKTNNIGNFLLFLKIN